MLRLNMCPQLTFYSFAVIFALFLFVMFGCQMAIDGLDPVRTDDSRITKEFLPIDLGGTLTSHLSNKGQSIKKDYELYRPLTSLLIHINMQHLISNALMLVIWASYFETFLTTYRTPLIFGLSG